MADIRIDLKSELLNGQSVVFKAPCDCTAITGLAAFYHNGTEVVSERFTFKDAHGCDLTGIGNLFVKGSYVKVILDTTTHSAFIQNADNNSFVNSLEIQTTNATVIENTKHGGYRLTKMKANTVQNGTPSPSSPQPLLSTGDCVEMIQGYYSTTNGAYVSDNTSSYVCNKNPILCSSGDSIKINYGSLANFISAVYFDENMNYISHSYVESTNLSATIPTNAKWFTFSIKYLNNITPQNEGKVTITINGKYLGCAKTRLGVEVTQGYQASTNVNDTYHVCSKNPIPCKANDVVELIYDKITSALGFAFYDVNMNLLQSNNVVENANTLSATAPTNTEYVHFNIKDSNGITPDTVGKFALTINGVGESIAWYTTQYPMIKGSTLFRENGLVKAMHESGDIKVPQVSWGKTGTSVDRYYSTLDSIGVTNVNENKPFLCTHFIQGGNGESIGNLVVSSGRIGFAFAEKDTTTYSDFNAFLSNNDVHLQYPLATPIIETLDNASQIALNSLETFDGMTIVEFDTRVQPLEFEAEVGTSKVGATALKGVAEVDSLKVEVSTLAGDVEFNEKYRVAKVSLTVSNSAAGAVFNAQLPTQFVSKNGEFVQVAYNDTNSIIVGCVHRPTNGGAYSNTIKAYNATNFMSPALSINGNSVFLTLYGSNGIDPGTLDVYVMKIS